MIYAVHEDLPMLSTQDEIQEAHGRLVKRLDEAQPNHGPVTVFHFDRPDVRQMRVECTAEVPE